MRESAARMGRWRIEPLARTRGNGSMGVLGPRANAVGGRYTEVQRGTQLKLVSMSNRGFPLWGVGLAIGCAVTVAPAGRALCLLLNLFV